MLKILFIIFTILNLAVAATNHLYKDVDVLISSGLLRGTVRNCGPSCFYYAFKGVPYAQPPIGDLRFRAPLPHSGWDGVREAFEDGPNCPTNAVFGGLKLNHHENCLFLNVYSQSLTGSMPVIVYFHSGSFTGQSGNTFVYGPDYFVEEGVVLVTLNYRMGPLGFLSTGDSNAPGNYGLKDGVMALKWVRNNIKAFGGDPNQVTIFGQSVGGAAVHYLVLSPAAKGLFHRAISQSGSALNPWAYQAHPLEQTNRYAKRLNLTYTDNADLVRQLRAVDYNDLISATPSFREYAFPFAPCKDPPETSRNEKFLPDDPLQLILSGSFNEVPYIIGFNDGEGLFSIEELRRDPQVFDVLNKNPYLFIPPSWNIPRRSQDEADVIRKIREFYFKNSTLNNNLKYEFTQYNTDVLFAHGIDQAARLHARLQSLANPVYYYKFNFVGRMNIIKTTLLLNDYPGAAHGDELSYLFKVTRIPQPLPIILSNSTLYTRRRMVRMWTNFARNGIPTPLLDTLATVRWNPIFGEKQQFLNIDEHSVMSQNPLNDRMNFWNRLQAKYSYSPTKYRNILRIRTANNIFCDKYNEIRDMLKDKKKQAKDKLDETKDKAGEKFDEKKEVIGEKKDKVKEKLNKIKDFVKQNCV